MAADGRGSHAIEVQFAQLKLIDEHINHSDRISIRNIGTQSPHGIAIQLMSFSGFRPTYATNMEMKIFVSVSCCRRES